MKEKLVDAIPTLDLSEFLTGDKEKKQNFVNQLGLAFESIGFVAITNHGYLQENQEELYASIKEFYQLSDEVKLQYDGSRTGGQRGYTGKGKEHAAGRNVGDLKEFYHIGKYITESESDHYQKNIFPKEVPAFQTQTLNAYSTLEGIGKTMCSVEEIFWPTSAMIRFMN